MLIAVLNGSSKVTNAQCSTMTRAVSWQARHHIASAWDMAAPSVVFYRSPEDVPFGALQCLIADDADAADALGYHDQDPEGKPYLRVFVNVTLDNGGDIGVYDHDAVVPEDRLSVSTVLSHEVAEVMGDPECNRWAQRPDGRLICLELGDPVQSSSYAVGVVTGRRREWVAVSNFVWPAFFDDRPQAEARYDQLGRLDAPFTLDNGGYWIWTDGTSYGNEFGSHALDRLRGRAADKLHPVARTRRRYDTLERMGAVAVHDV